MGNNDREDVDQVLMEGWLLKKPSYTHSRKSKYWNKRYFVLHGQTLSYYTNKGDEAEKKSFQLVPGCTVGEIYLMEHKKKSQNSGTNVEIHDEHFEMVTDDNPFVTTTAPHKEMKPDNKHKDFKYCFKISWPEIDDQKPSLHVSPTKYKNNSEPASSGYTPISSPSTPSKHSKSESNVPKPIKVRSKSFKPRSTSPTSPVIQKHSRANSINTIAVGDIEETKFDNRKTQIDSQNELTKHYSQQIQQQVIANEQVEERMKSLARTAKRSAKKKIMQGGGIVAATTGAVVTASILTTGVGLVAGLLFIGISAAAGGSGAVVTKSYYKNKHGHILILAVANRQEAEKWRVALNDTICRNRGTMWNQAWTSLFITEGKNPADFLLPTSRSDSPKSLEKSNCFGSDSNPSRVQRACIRWEPVEGGWVYGAHGLRVFREEKKRKRGIKDRFQLSVKGRPCPPMKAQVILNAYPLNAFMCLMSHPCIRPEDVDNDGTILPASGQRTSFRIVEKKDSNSDIIHLVFRPLYLFPSWTAPRDFCINRYWRLEDDGSYIVCYDSVVHPHCPPCPPYVRGELNGIYSITPRKRINASEMQEECLLTHIVQVDPRGWVPTMNLPYFGNQVYAEAFGMSSLLQMIDIKDALDYERFVPVSVDDTPPRKIVSSMQLNKPKDSEFSEEDHIHYDFAFSREVHANRRDINSNLNQTLSSYPTPLQTDMWAECDANSYKVRGKYYKKDKKKIHAGKCMFRLLAVDLLRVTSQINHGVSKHPKERIQQALARESEMKKSGSNETSDMPPFVFVVNLASPNPLIHMVFYYAVDDMSTIDGTNGTPFSKLANKFFFGDSDDFRHHTFKLIPQIVEGNFLVRKAVGSTPAISGRKLKQYYVREDRFFELILDIGSSSVATGVLGLVSGYAKHITIDMAFLLEGNDETTLPEKVMATCRLKNVDLIKAPRDCEQYEDDSIFS